MLIQIFGHIRRLRVPTHDFSLSRDTGNTRCLSGLLLLFLLQVAFADAQQAISFQEMKGFPTAEQGIEKGVSSCFAGCLDHSLIIAGGCNFPDRPPQEGGRKKYYQGIYAAVLDGSTQLVWKEVGQLPAPCAYGVSLQTRNGIICIGGNNAEERLRDAFVIQFANNKATTAALPRLPQSMDNFAGAIEGSKVNVYSDRDAWELDLENVNAGWKPILQRNETRVQPVGGVADGQFCVWGGYSPKSATAHATLNMDGFACTPSGSSPLSTPEMDGEKVFLGGSASINLGADSILVVGGVNKDIFLKALNNPPEGYMLHTPEWYRFNPHLFIYSRKRWHHVASSPLAARAGTTLARQGNNIYAVGGELKPGVRLPNVLRITFRQ